MTTHKLLSAALLLSVPCYAQTAVIGLPGASGGSSNAVSVNGVPVGSASALSALAGAASAATAQAVGADVAGAAALVQIGRNPKSYGSFADGAEHLASTQFGTLAACQAAHPTCAALTDSIDTLAIEEARMAAAASLTHFDQISLPRGIYRLSRPLVAPTESLQSFPTGSAFSLAGSGENATILQPTAAMLATGVPILACGQATGATPTNGLGRYGASGGCTGNFTNFTIQTSDHFVTSLYSEAAPTVDGVPVTTDCILAGSGMHIANVVVQGCRYGINAVGDHMVWENFKAIFNQVGIYMAPQSQSRYGDLTFINPILSANSYAGILVSKNAYLSVAVAGQFYSSGSPYSILGEAGTPDAYINLPSLPILYNSTFQNTLAEYLSNGFIVDANTFGGGSATRNLIATTLDHTSVIGCSGNAGCAAYTTGGQTASAWVNVAYLSGVKLHLQANSLVPPSGMVAGILAKGVGPTFGGDYGGLDMGIYPELLTSAYVNVPLFGGFTNGQDDTSCDYVRITTGGGWSGKCVNLPSSGTFAIASLAQGTVMTRVYEAMGIPWGAAGVQGPVAGINMQSWTSSPNGKTTLIATSGVVPNVPYTGTIARGGIAKAAATGSTVACTDATSSACTDGSRVGQYANAGATTANVRLMLGY